MPGWSALVLAAPLFGMSLTPLEGVPQERPGFQYTLETPTTLIIGDTVAPPAEASEPPADTVVSPPVEVEATATEEIYPEPATAGAATPAPPLPTVAESTPAATTTSDEDAAYARDVLRRRELGQIHRAMGIATWIAMTLNLAVGFMQFHDLYGLGSPGQNGNPCATGNDVWLGECYGDPYAHIISATTTSVLYGGTFILSLVMPDPNQASEGNGAFAQHLRIHEVLRWIHGIGMLAQIVIGAMLSNGVFGDRANNYDTLEIVADIHQAIGWTTWGALSAAAAIMIF